MSLQSILPFLRTLFQQTNHLLKRAIFGSSTSEKSYSHISTYLREHGIIKPTETYRDFLIKAKIISETETPDTMFQRVASTLAKGGENFYGSSQIPHYQGIFLDMISRQKIILSTPLYTNAGRHLDKPLSACAVPPVNLANMSLDVLAKMVSSYHVKGMGTGFNFDESADPIATLLMLNKLAHAEVTENKIERPVGNMGIISVDHPQALDFVKAKNNPDVPSWKFNISINLTSGFFQALHKQELYKTPDGRMIDPDAFLQDIAKQAGATGDPGVVFMHKHEEHNKVPHLGHYVSTAPCGEIPLLSGEVCHFGYLNLNAFVCEGKMDYASLKESIHYLVLMLDNAIEVSIQSTLMPESIHLTQKIRKIGIGVCGFADMLVSMGLQYDSEEARSLAENIISFINFESKKASVELAKHRQPFPAYHDEHTRRDLIVGRYLNQSTQTVSTDDWHELQEMINQHGIRNLSTVILPPVGRSSLLGGVTASIEPIFKLALDPNLEKALESSCERHGYVGDFDKIRQIIRDTGSVQKTDLPAAVKDVFLTAIELSSQAHLSMTHVFQRFTDEAISKTVNLPQTATIDDITGIYRAAYTSELKGITIYVDQSRTYQPKKLSQQDLESTPPLQETGKVLLLSQNSSTNIDKTSEEKLLDQKSDISSDNQDLRKVRPRSHRTSKLKSH